MPPNSRRCRALPVRAAVAALVLALLTHLPLAVPAAAQDAGGTMGLLSTLLPESGTQGAWSVDNTAAAFTMTNRSEPNAVRYFYVNAGKERGARTISVNVSVEPRGPQPAMAGLLYGFDPEHKTYFMLVVENGERISLYHRGRRGLQRIVRRDLGPFSSGPYRLKMTEAGETVSLFIDGERVSVMKSNAAGRGATGIVAAGLGTFSFTGFSLADE